MLTLEIGARPIAVIDADQENARQLLDDEDFQEDLRSITSDGEPVWDGKADLGLRQATPQEEAVAREAAEEDDDEDEDEDDDAEEGDLLVVFLVPLDDDLED